jgi:hypothetical protein
VHTERTLAATAGNHACAAFDTTAPGLWAIKQSMLNACGSFACFQYAWKSPPFSFRTGHVSSTTFLYTWLLATRGHKSTIYACEKAPHDETLKKGDSCDKGRPKGCLNADLMKIQFGLKGWVPSALSTFERTGDI